MYPVACGFNGFGQFSNHHRNEFRKFEKIELSCKTKCFALKCTWSYLVAVYENNVEFRGFICGASNTSKMISSVGKIVDVSVCDDFCLMLEQSGKLYKVEPGRDCQLKEVVFTVDKGITYKDTHSSGIDIRFIACGNNITFAISKDNAAYGSVDGKSFCIFKNKEILEAKCGFEHVIIMCNDDIYTWGNGLRGQLGTKETYASKNQSNVAYLLSALSGIKIKFIAAGGWHSAAISRDGDIYTWGWNSFGQLGIQLYRTDSPNVKEPSVYAFPRIIDLPVCACAIGVKKMKLNNDEQLYSRECMPLQISIGNRHTVLLKECGAIYATGWNGLSQLGIETDEKCCDSFKYVRTVEISESNVRLICGSWCTIIY